MLTLSFGFKKPLSNDKGPQVFPAMEDNIQQLNDHTHNGVNSSKLPGSSLEPTTQVLLAAGWVLVANGHYNQTATLPGGLLYDKVTLRFRLNSTGHDVFPTVLKASATQYTVYFDDPSLDLLVQIN